MQARDFMTADPVSATPDTPVRVIAQRLLSRGISALPIVNADNEVVGMVSEGDLVRAGSQAIANAEASEQRQDWWLSLLAEGQPLAKPFLDTLSAERTAAQVMSSPVVTVTGGTDLGEIARLLDDYGIKRVPVVEGRKLVGIISRADLLRAFIHIRPARPHPAGGLEGLIAEATASLGKYLPEADAGPPAFPPPQAGQDSARVYDADSFRALMTDFRQQHSVDRMAARHQAAQAQKEMVRELIATHVSDKMWADMLNDAADAAGRGLNEHLLLRFPKEVCSDGGRAINQGEAGWAATLRGEPAEIYLRWRDELQPHGFRLKARTIGYVEGFPGDIGLFLNWAPDSIG